MAGPIVAASSHGPGHDHEDKGVCFDRVTKTGRHLWYVLKVIQQPERARACGSGPKSSADRRPVNPPPVVELRIYEGPTFEQAQNKDITFLYNANFFLYATLEHARVMAHGRVQSPAVNTPPVLTGVPVSGMAYLDRPKEAGYFLFPDLSVRHEGRYRFNFNLYEETKEEKDRSDNGNSAEAANPAIGGSFDWIMEVKTQDFLVYSAKKFPGLTESTALSRVVAEQGCRVRIRRDVRMRRRPGKDGNDNYDNAEEEYNRRRRTETPEAQREAYRARSMSGSVERTPYSTDSQRRGSGVEYPPPPPSHYHHPQTPTSAVSGHLNFLGGNSSQSFAPPPSGPASSVPTSPAFPPPGHGGSYGYQHASHQPQPPAPAPYYPERRLSQSYAPPPPPPSLPTKIEAENGRPEPIKLPSFSDLKSRLSDDFPRASIASTSQYSQPAYSPTSSGPSRSHSYAGVGTNGVLPPPPGMFSRSDASIRAGQKRAHGDVFGATDYDLAPRRNGTRESGETEDPDNIAVMVYARAGGDHAVSQAYA
ncbi:hypothetical protein GQ53DRAFT_251958 [Thozetella sp. PMI_491]|nr:hypothetical protein GQ53DRAFT_251958 [Thozetella sp. PMI_491]